MAVSGRHLRKRAGRPTHDPANKRQRHTGRNHPADDGDPGVTDKRLLIVEPEFARVLQVAERDTNTLSAIIRQAWDTGNLRILTKKQAASATDAYVSMIAHITRDELRRLLTDTATANGSANPFPMGLCTSPQIVARRRSVGQRGLWSPESPLASGSRFCPHGTADAARR